MEPSNAECVSMCGESPTPRGYSFTCKQQTCSYQNWFVALSDTPLIGKSWLQYPLVICEVDLCFMILSYAVRSNSERDIVSFKLNK